MDQHLHARYGASAPCAQPASRPAPRSGSDAGRAALQPGAAGAIDTARTTKIAVRTGLTRRGSALAGVDLEEGSSRSVVEQLRSILSKNAVRVIDLFREWDEDGDGEIA